MQKKSEINNKFIFNSFWVFISHSMVYIKGIILLPILIKTVGVSIYGANSLIASYVNILFGVSSLGIGFMYTRFMPSLKSCDIEKKQDLFYFQFFWQCIFLLIISIILIATNNFLKQTFFSNNISYSIFFPIAILFSLFMFHQFTNYFRYTHRLKLNAIMCGIMPYLYISLILLGVFFSSNVDLNYLMKCQSISYFILSFPLFYLIIKEIGFKIPKTSVKKLLSHIKVGFPLIFVFIIDFILNGSDRFVIAYYMTTKFVGYYNPGYVLGSLVIMFPKMIGVSLPQLLALSSKGGDLSESKKLIEKSIKFFLIICIPFIIGGAVLSRSILTLLANKEVANISYLVTPIVSCGILFYGLNYILANTIFYLKLKNHLIMYANFIAAFLNIILNIIFISIFKSIIVAAITTFISYLIAFLFLHHKAKNIMKIDYAPINVIKIICASVIMGGYLILLNKFINNVVIILFFLIPSTILLYSVLIYYFHIITKSEIQFIIEFIKTKMKKKET